MLPPIPPRPEERRRALSQVPGLKREALRRRRRRRFVAGGTTTMLLAAAAGLSAWLVPSQGSSTVKVISPSPPVSTRGTTLPAIASTPWTSLVYEGPGVVVVGISPDGAGYQGARPSALYLTSDMVHWTNITPPQSQTSGYGGFGWFEHASFLNPSTGWVTSWNPDTRTAIYRTGDGGKTWTTVPGVGHSANAGATTLIDLISPTTAFEELLEPTGPGMNLYKTTDSGDTWKQVFGGSGPAMILMPMTFTDVERGFAAYGSPPSPPFGGLDDFFETSNGGSTWQRESPPLPNSRSSCPATFGYLATSACSYTLPIFSDPLHGATASVVTAASKAEVAFDVTSDGGQRWTRSAQLSITISPNSTQAPGQSGTFGYPLISIGPANSWWVLGWNGSSASTEISSDGGATWRTDKSSIPTGVPTSLNAFSSTQALLTITSMTPDGSTNQVLYTKDKGLHWAPLRLPPSDNTATSAAIVSARLCSSAFGTTYANSDPTTVEDVRSLQVGPGYQPGKGAFRGAAGTQVAAWCWTGSPGIWRLYAVAQGYPPVLTEGVSFSQIPSPGPAPIP